MNDFRALQSMLRKRQGFLSLRQIRLFFHRERISLLVAPLRFAMVLLNTGDVVEWVGRDRDYADALRQAKNSVDGCDIEQFFAKSTRKINPKFDLRMRWRKEEERSE